MRNTRTINTTKHVGYCRKLASQFQGKWASYEVQVQDKNTWTTFRTCITKLHKMWINDHDAFWSSNINDMINHVLTYYAK